MARGTPTDPAYFARNRKKCHIRQFHAILDVCRPGLHAPAAAVIGDRCPMRIRRGNFHIISPSPTRRPESRAIFVLAANVHVSHGIPIRARAQLRKFSYGMDLGTWLECFFGDRRTGERLFGYMIFVTHFYLQIYSGFSMYVHRGDYP